MSINEIFDEYEKSVKDIEISVDELKKEMDTYSGIVLYGAGSAGIAFFHYLKDVGIDILFFSDGDTEKHGNKLEGVEIISPKDIIHRVDENVLVVVTINTDGKTYCRDFKKELLAGGHEGVHKKLADYGCKNVVDYVYFQKCFSLFEGGRYNLPACSDVKLMYEHKEDVIKAYDILCDEESKRTFLGILEYRLLLKDVDIPTISEKKQYFEYDLFPKIDDEVFIDCGACGGSSLKIFLEEVQGNFGEYYGIEPDKKNFAKLEQYINSLDNIDKYNIYNKAVYDKIGKANFFELGGPGTFASENGTDNIDTVTIDSILDGKRASYIKMNIEGSEIPALMGAKETIIKYKPRLAIMGYHKSSDLWEVPIKMFEYNDKYKVHLRSYMKNVAFCYYAN